MIWARAEKLALTAGIVAWALAIALTPGEIAAAKRRAPLSPRSGLTLACYLAAAVLVLRGLPRQGTPPDLPQR